MRAVMASLDGEKTEIMEVPSDLIEHDGYIGIHTRQEAPGAFPNGTRIKKVTYTEGDSTEIGQKGTVLGSIAVDLEEDVPYFYFVEWDWKPRHAVGIVSVKIGLADEKN
jgi:hypothetical protein